MKLKKVMAINTKSYTDDIFNSYGITDPIGFCHGHWNGPWPGIVGRIAKDEVGCYLAGCYRQPSLGPPRWPQHSISRPFSSWNLDRSYRMVCIGGSWICTWRGRVWAWGECVETQISLSYGISMDPYPSQFSIPEPPYPSNIWIEIFLFWISWDIWTTTSFWCRFYSNLTSDFWRSYNSKDQGRSQTQLSIFDSGKFL